MNSKVKAFILVIYAAFTAFCIYSVMEMKIYYSSELNITEGYVNHQFVEMRNKYWGYVYRPIIYVKLDNDTDFYSEEAQLKHLLFEEAVQTCHECRR